MKLDLIIILTLIFTPYLIIGMEQKLSNKRAYSSNLVNKKPAKKRKTESEQEYSSISNQEEEEIINHYSDANDIFIPKNSCALEEIDDEEKNALKGSIFRFCPPELLVPILKNVFFNMQIINKTSNINEGVKITNQYLKDSFKSILLTCKHFLVLKLEFQESKFKIDCLQFYKQILTSQFLELKISPVTFLEGLYPKSGNWGFRDFDSRISEFMLTQDSNNLILSNLISETNSKDIHLACQVIPTLIFYNANVNAQGTSNTPSTTALMLAAQNGYDKIVKILLANGALVNLCNTFGNTALMLAVRNAHNKIVKVLLTNRAHVNLYNEMLRTPLILAAAKGHSGIVKRLLSYGANVDHQDRYGRTALMEAASEGYNEIINMLLNHHANIDLQDQMDLTALMIATNHGHKKTVKKLLSHNANINLKDEEGNTASMLAQKNEYYEIAHIIEICNKSEMSYLKID